MEQGAPGLDPACLAPALRPLRHLRTLALQNCQLESLPAGLPPLRHLTALDISGNEVGLPWNIPGKEAGPAACCPAALPCCPATLPCSIAGKPTLAACCPALRPCHPAAYAPAALLASFG